MNNFKEFEDLFRTEFQDVIKSDPSLKLQEGERRNVSILYADIKGFTSLSEKLDPEYLKTIVDKLLQLFTLCIKKYGGYIDKYEGDLVMALFGAKTATEEDTERAVNSALLIIEKLKHFNNLICKVENFKNVKFDVRIGINTGFVTTGKVGEKREGDFTVYGDAVNLASRLESKAPLNNILISQDTMEKIKDKFVFKEHGYLKFKGISNPVSTFTVIKRRKTPLKRWQGKKSKFIGRDSDLKIIKKCLNDLLIRVFKSKYSNNDLKKPTVIGIKGEAGIGKSRLIHEFLETSKERFKFIQVVSPRYAQNPYCIFIPLIENILNVTYKDSKEEIENKILDFGSGLNLKNDEEREELTQISPYIAHLLGIILDGRKLNIQARELQKHIQASIKTLLEFYAKKINENSRLLIVIIEDIQWLDEASRSTLNFIITNLNVSREKKNLCHIFFLITYRSDYNVEEYINKYSFFNEIKLQSLNFSDFEKLFYLLTGNIKISEEKIKTIFERSEGNPFYIEELVNLLLDSENSDKLDTLPIPHSLNSLILSRLDSIEKENKLLLQKASVIGREFSFDILFELENKIGVTSDIKQKIDDLEQSDFIFKTNKPELYYLFKQATTQEVAYNTLLISNRKILHRIIAEIIEKTFVDNIKNHLYELAVHYYKSDNDTKAMYYLEKAADKAKNNFENKRAIDFYDKLIFLYKNKDLDVENILKNESISLEKILELKNLIPILLKKAEVLQLSGLWINAEDIYRKVIQISEKIDDKNLIATSLLKLGKHLQVKGDIEESLKVLKKAEVIFTDIDNLSGLGTTYSHTAILYTIQGRFAEALDLYKKASNLNTKNPDEDRKSAIVGGMGIAYKMMDNNKKAIECFNEQLKISEKIGDKIGMSTALGNIGTIYNEAGDFDRAEKYNLKDMKICKYMGDKRGIAIATENLGIIYSHKNNYKKALVYLFEALNLSEELGDKEGVGTSSGSIGVVYKKTGDFDKSEFYLNKSVTILKEINFNFYLCFFLIAKAELLIEKGEFDKAEGIIGESIKISKEINSKNIYIQSKILVLKLEILKNEIKDKEEIITFEKNLTEEIISKSENIEEDKALISSYIQKILKELNL